MDTFGDGEYFLFLSPPITIGWVSQMVAMYRAIAEGSVTLAELECFEALASQRQAATAEGSARTVEVFAQLRGRNC